MFNENKVDTKIGGSLSLVRVFLLFSFHVNIRWQIRGRTSTMGNEGELTRNPVDRYRRTKSSH